MRQMVVAVAIVRRDARFRLALRDVERGGQVVQMNFGSKMERNVIDVEDEQQRHDGTPPQGASGLWQRNAVVVVWSSHTVQRGATGQRLA
jgi:hypothetical protein